MIFLRWGCAFLIVILLSACSSRVDLFTGLSEQDANEVVAALIQAGIASEKVAVPKSGHTVKVLTVELATAVAHLSRLGLPRNTYKRMGDVFKKEGVVSTPIEERSRYLYALSQELENTLNQIDGVILARVHPVLAERLVPGEPAQPPSCSVLVKHRSDWDPLLYEERIRRLVVSSIPGLAQARSQSVSIVFVPADPLTGGQVASSMHSQRSEAVSWVQWLMIGGLIIVMLISAMLLVWQWLMERRFISNTKVDLNSSAERG